jgi:hypothetical protein
MADKHWREKLFYILDGLIEKPHTLTDESKLSDARVSIGKIVTEESEKSVEQYIDTIPFRDLLNIAQRILDEKYPEDVFAGTSPDVGVVFIVQFRKLVKNLHKQLYES